MKANEAYYAVISEMLARIMETQGEAMEKAAAAVADQIAEGGRVFVFGTGGHCTRVAEELFWRSGGLACVRPILDAGLQIVHGATRATKTERMEGYAKAPLDYYGVGEGDLLLLVNAYGINAVTIDTVHECKKRGAKIVAVTSFEFPASTPAGHPARHSTNENLCDIVDIAVDNMVPPGDAVVSIDGFPYKVAASSTMTGVFILNAMVARIVELLLEKGVQPPVWVSANAPGGDAWNKQFIEQYGSIRHL